MKRVYGNIVKRNSVYIAIALLAFSGLSACKPKYGVNETPVMTTAAAEVEIPMDFDQIHNDVLESVSPSDYPFVKNLNISGDNSAKTVNVEVEIVENVSTEALNTFLNEVMKTIANEDGSFFKKYGVHYIVKQGEETVEDVTVDPGEAFPFSA